MTNTLPKLHLVNSTNLQSIGYRRNDNALYVRFRSGTLYRYNNVAYKDYLSLRRATSIGQLFNAIVRPLPNYERLK